jgi:hypothetical protein
MIDREGREMAHGIYWTNISNLDGDPNLSDAEIRISNKGFVMAVGTTVVVGAGVYVGLEAVAAYGTATVVTTVASEVFDESLDAVVAEVRPELAGIPLSPSDMLEYGVKKVSKSLAKEGIEVTEDVTGTVAKKIPNPNGKKGGPLHQGEITETINTLKNNGYSSIKKERYVPTPNGSKRGRFADIYAIDPNGESVFFQVGKQNKSGLPVKREREAIEDLYQVYPEAQYYFIPYNK